MTEKETVSLGWGNRMTYWELPERAKSETNSVIGLVVVTLFLLVFLAFALGVAVGYIWGVL